METVGLSDLGRKRNRNEDSFATSPERRFVVVADGMGGLPAGDLASRLAVQVMTGALADDGARSADGMVGAIRAANERVLRAAEEAPGRRGMGTTVTALQIVSDSGEYVVGHVGDSRAYLFSKGVLHRLTKDQTWVQAQIDAGALPPELAAHHPLGHILLQVVGTEGGVDPEIVEGRAAPGDFFLLCTDGLVAVLDDGDLAEIAEEGASRGLAWTAARLVERANEGGGPDNITVALLRIAAPGS